MSLAPAARASTLVHRFAEQVSRRPQAAAVIDGDTVLTYAELSAYADMIASRVQGHGIGRGDIVGVHVGRSAEMVAAILGVLKAGAAYLPLDPQYPPNRIRYLASDAGIRLVVASGVVEVPGVDIVLLNGAPDEEEHHCHLVQSADDAAYVIYTSGTTGNPKGVVVEHQSVLSLFEASRDFGFGPEDVWTLFHSFAFDFSVWEIFGALLHGGQLVIVPIEETRDPERFAKLLRRHRVTVLNQTPSAFRTLVHVAPMLPDIRLIVLGGEPLDTSTAVTWYAKQGTRAKLVNMYGITETTVHVTALELSPEFCEMWRGPGTPIGDALPNVSVILVDPQTGQRCAPGEVGEIWVTGGGVARGYLHQPALTAQRFVRDGTSGAVMYRSGDLGRIDRDGRLVHLGRLDAQLKVRGFRIEPEEVEAQIARHSGVEASAVTKTGEGADATLVAHVVPDAADAGPVRRMLRLAATNPQMAEHLFDLPNGTALLGMNDGEMRFLYEELYVREAYARAGIAIPDHGIVFDVGANVGMFALWAAEQAADLTIFSFEPLPPTFEMLKGNFELHAWKGRAINVGLGSGEEKAEFSYFPHDTIFSGRFVGDTERGIVNELLRRGDPTATQAMIDELLGERMRTEPFQCVVRPLSAMIAEIGVPSIDLLKVDAERSERDVLAGIGDGDWPKIKQIVIEVHDTSELPDLQRQLDERGFSLEEHEDEYLHGLGLTNLYGRRRTAGGSIGHPPGRPYRGPSALTQSLRADLQETLPSYSVPSRIELVEGIPLTANGKIDRAALAAGVTTTTTSEPAHALSTTERTVAEAFSTALGRPVSSGEDDFFELGGQSLTAIAVVRALRTRYGPLLPIALLFQNSTVSAVAADIESRLGEEVQLEHAGREGDGAA